MKSFWYAALLSGLVLGLTPSAQAQPSTPAGKNPWDPGVADKEGRVINPIFRKEKDRPGAPVDRGIDADLVQPAGPKPSPRQTSPQISVTPAPATGNSPR